MTNEWLHPFDDAHVAVGALAERAQGFLVAGAVMGSLGCATLSNSMITVRCKTPDS